MTTKRALLALVFAGLVPLTLAGLSRSAGPAGPLILSRSAKEPSPMLGLVADRTKLARVDGRRFQAVGRRLKLGATAASWAYSPDWSTLALGLERRRPRSDIWAVSVRFVRPSPLRSAGRVMLGSGALPAVAWLGADRLLAVRSECCPGGVGLVTIDAARRKVVAEETVEGQLLRVDRARNGLVLLLGPSGRVGAARLVVVDPAGVRTVSLDGIPAGFEHPEYDGTGPPPVGRIEEPALAVDSTQGRAYVITGDGRIASIELGSLAVSYHSLAHASFLSRLSGWLQPTAEAKEVEGSIRTARWLGGDQVLLTGEDVSVSGDGMHSTPAGIRLVDASSWTARTIDTQASAFDLGSDLLLATNPASWSGAVPGIGLVAYGRDGAKRFSVLDGKRVTVSQVFGERAYLGATGRTVVDLAAGRLRGTRKQAPPYLVTQYRSALD